MVKRFEKGIKYSPELVYTYMISCVVDDRGVPRFMEHLFGAPLEEGSAILTCRDTDDQDLLVSLKINEIPPEIYEIILEKGPHRPAEWKKILAAILEPDTIIELQKRLGRRVLSSDDVKRMIQIALQVKTKKVPKEKAIKYLERILGPETFYEVLDTI